MAARGARFASDLRDLIEVQNVGLFVDGFEARGARRVGAAGATKDATRDATDSQSGQGARKMERKHAPPGKQAGLINYLPS